MRKETKKLAHPNFIVSSLEKPIYSTTTISHYCNVGGPDCNYSSVDEEDHHQLGWATGEDFGRNGDYDFDICPDCQKTNCMKCFDEEPLLDTGQCQNQNCVSHRNCSECEEPYFNNRYGDSYCINEDCGKNENNIKHKEGSRSYWVSCDGPDCDSEGYDPEYDMGKDWHQTSSSYDGEITTDYCDHCWDNKVCKSCETPYDDEENHKFGIYGKQMNSNDMWGNQQVCHNYNCDDRDTCRTCGSEVNKFGNCTSHEGGIRGYGECGTCRHCHEDLKEGGRCINDECEAHDNPYYELFGGKSDKVS
jgi:hypothetical protein